MHCPSRLAAAHPIATGVYHSLIMFAFVATAIFSSEPSPPPSFTEQCAGSFLRAGLNFAQFELYDRWFDDNSSLTLAQAGTYNGARDIVCHTEGSNPGL